ncbi:MAG: hypothetical protein ABR905_23210 [Terracidiphilus sp.]|jgi:hypothetical protein
MGFALWIDHHDRVAWAQGTHEYRPMGTAAIAVTDQFRHRDFCQTRRAPRHVRDSFVGFFGSLGTINDYLRSSAKPVMRRTPAHLI